MIRSHLILVATALTLTTSLSAVRVKDISTLRGARDNQLVGYGIVVGLAGTGDKNSELTEGSLAMVLKGLGVDPKTQKVDTRNAAAVVASATLPPFGRIGNRIDLQISSVGSATSLEGGTLMMTALKGPDGVVYAMGQGKVVTQKKAESPGKSTTQNLSTAMVPSGGILEREIGFEFSTQRELRYLLNNPDFTTAVRMAKKINEELSGKYANAIDGGTVDVLLPYQYDGNPVELIAQIENLDVEADRKAKVVINTRSGTVVLGDQVRVAPVAIAQNNLKIEVKQPERVVSSEPTDSDVPAADATVKPAHKVMLMNGTSVADIVGSLNEMGASSEDLVGLLQSLKSSGALMAELEMQ